MTTKKSVVPGVAGAKPAAGSRTKKPAAPAAAQSDLRPRETATGSDLRPRTQPVGDVNHANVLKEEVTSQVNHAQARTVAPAAPAPATVDRNVIAAVLAEMGMLPAQQVTTGEEPREVTLNRAIAAPYGGNGETPRAPNVPSLVSQGLVNVLTQLRQMPAELVDAKLDDLAGVLALRSGAVTSEARQRYTLMACVQIVQDFEQLWGTPAAPLR